MKLFLKLCYLVICLTLISCATRKETSLSKAAGGNAITYCAAGMTQSIDAAGNTICSVASSTACTTTCAAQSAISCPSGFPAGTVCTTPVSTVTSTVGLPVMSAGIGTTGPSIPDSYTFLTTPHANECIDAFYRNGFPLPVNATAKTLNVHTIGSRAIISDIVTTPTPVMTIVDATQINSDVTIQLLNHVGFYCIIGLDSVQSNVTIQHACSAQVASIEPQTINSVPTKTRVASYCPSIFDWFFPRYQEQPSNTNFYGNSNSAGSSVQELQCIP